MSDVDQTSPSNGVGVKHKGGAKTARIPIKVVASEPLRKPLYAILASGGRPQPAQTNTWIEVRWAN